MSNRDLRYSIERQADRQQVDLRVRLLYSKEGVQETVHGRGSDLSEGGMAIYAAVEVEEGVRVQIEFTLSQSRRTLWIEAVVRNKQGYRYGVEFLTLSASQRDEIRRICHAAKRTELL